MLRTTYLDFSKYLAIWWLIVWTSNNISSCKGILMRVKIVPPRGLLLMQPCDAGFCFSRPALAHPLAVVDIISLRNNVISITAGKENSHTSQIFGDAHSAIPELKLKISNAQPRHNSPFLFHVNCTFPTHLFHMIVIRFFLPSRDFLK